MKGYAILHIDTKKTFTSRNVSFHEHILSYNVQTPCSTYSWTYYPPNSSHDPTKTIISQTNSYDQEAFIPDSNLPTNFDNNTCT